MIGTQTFAHNNFESKIDPISSYFLLTLKKNVIQYNYMLKERKETGEVAPSTNPEKRPDLQDYKDKKNQRILILVRIATRYFLA
jgi:hypothetical protein